MNIVLCGYMGSGKTTVGKLLSSELNVDFVDLDQVIVETEKMAVSDIFKEKGEIYFRKLENKTLKEVISSAENRIISLGGGTPCYGNNMDVLKNSGETKMVYLKMSVEALTDRLFEEKNTRPVIAHYTEKKDLQDFVRKHLFERGYYYLQSDLIVEVGNKSPEIIAKEIVAALN